MELQIPDGARLEVAKLLKTPVEVFEQISRALREAHPHMRTRDLASELQPSVDVGQETLRSLVELLASWYWVRSDTSREPDKMVAELQQAAMSSGDATIADGWDERKAAITEILSNDKALGMTSKAQFLSMQSFRNYSRARIFTDARPIFPADAKQPPSSFVLLHTLQIQAFDIGEPKDWYFTLDINDLREIRDAADRAIQKHETMSVWLSTTKVPLLGV